MSPLSQEGLTTLNIMELTIVDQMRATRRQFLKVAASTVAMPYVIAGSALGAGDKVAPSERVNMGFIGLGGQGSGHLLGGAWTYVPGGYVARNDVQVLAVCDVRRERRDAAGQRCNQIYAERFGRPGYNGVKAYNDFREVYKFLAGDLDIGCHCSDLWHHSGSAHPALARRLSCHCYAWVW